jgi:hypothetical protein
LPVRLFTTITTAHSQDRLAPASIRPADDSQADLQLHSILSHPRFRNEESQHFLMRDPVHSSASVLLSKAGFYASARLFQLHGRDPCWPPFPTGSFGSASRHFQSLGWNG